MMRVVLAISLLVMAADTGRLTIHNKEFYKDGQKVFLSGANTAWVAYGYDFGNNQYQQRREKYIHRLDLVKNAGGNSMRTWVHIHGATSPKFDNNGFVIGLDNDNSSFIAEFTQYLDDAKERGILIFPCLWNGAVIQEEQKLRGLITETDKLQSYLDNALIPWVTAVKDHPALGGWDIINEWEGFVKPDVHDSEKCFDTTVLHNSGAGWAGQKYSVHDILRFVNWQAHGIYRADPQALVTAGSASQVAQVEINGKFNYYKDHCLIAAGGKPRGVLNFYSTHCYAWQGNFAPEAVFLHNASDYHLDKPIVIAEFQEHDHQGANLNDVDMFNYIYTHGYQGAWVWSDDTEEAQAAGIAALKGLNGPAGLVNFTV